MAFLSALPSGGVCAVFTDAQLAKTSEATSSTVVRWSFMAFLNAKFRGLGQSFRASSDLKSLAPERLLVTCNLSGFDCVHAMQTGRPEKNAIIPAVDEVSI